MAKSTPITIALAQPQIELCEMPVKTLLRDYFLQFSNENIAAWCRNNQQYLIAVPSGHRSAGNLITSLGKLPKTFVKSDSIFHIPLKTSELYVEKRGAPEMWGFRLECRRDPDPTWDEAALSHFGKQLEDAKKCVGMLLTAARAYMQMLRSKHAEFRAIELDLDTERMVMWIRDERLPRVKYPAYLRVFIHRLTGEEIDAILASG